MNDKVKLGIAGAIGIVGGGLLTLLGGTPGQNNTDNSGLSCASGAPVQCCTTGFNCQSTPDGVVCEKCEGWTDLGKNDPTVECWKIAAPNNE